MPTSQKMTQKAQELQVQFDVLHEKIARLRKAVAIETDPTLKLKFEKQLEEAEAEREQITRQLQKFEQQLPALPLDRRANTILADQQEQEHHQPKKQEFSSGVQIGNVSGGITNSIIAGGNVSDVTIQVRKDKKRRAKRQGLAENDDKQNS
jgi:hypothetical protein